MSLSKKIQLRVKGYEITPSDRVQIYKNDSIDLIFTVFEYGIIVKNGLTYKDYMAIEPLSANLLIETPYGQDYIESTIVKDNEITFHLTKDYTQNVGVTKMAIVLLGEDEYKITLPPFDFEIRNTINENWDGEDLEFPNILLDDEGNILLADEDTAIIR